MLEFIKEGLILNIPVWLCLIFILNNVTWFFIGVRLTLFIKK